MTTNAEHSYVALIEQTMVAVREATLDAIRSTHLLMGDRPYGYFDGSIWERLEQYLDVKTGGVPAWEQRIAARAGQVGRAKALYEAAQTSREMERQLSDHGGAVAVRMYWNEARSREALRAMDAARRLEETEKVMIAPPVPVAAFETGFAVGVG